MTLQEIQQQVQKLCEDTQTIMAALANMIEDSEKGGPGSGRKPGGGRGSEAADEDGHNPESDTVDEEMERASQQSAAANQAISKLNVPDKMKKDLENIVADHIATAVNMSDDVDKDAMSDELQDALGYTDMEHEDIVSAVNAIKNSF
jgi:hypothetical protein